jgi:S-adenosylmethionine:tRNA ribosyltransferase-isomerase
VILEHSQRLRVGEVLTARGPAGPGESPASIGLSLDQRCDGGLWWARVQASGTTEEILRRIGWTPLPSYIRRLPGDAAAESADQAAYQTVYARRPGAIAAPTAGLHLTEAVLAAVRERGVETAFVTLHVGLGTFAPIRVPDLADHRMHGEWYEVSGETAAAVQRCRARDGRVVAVGTTSVRALESAADPATRRMVAPGRGMTERLLYPPCEFRVVDRLLTNFHLPRSSLLALVMAFAGCEAIRAAYRHAIEERYRFYSYGDAMLIL